MSGNVAGNAVPAGGDPPWSPKPDRKRILVVANREWEAAPLLGVLAEARACPPGFPWAAWPGNGPRCVRPLQKGDAVPPASPRAIYELGHAAVEIWCMQDLMNPEKSASSTAEKKRILPSIFGWKPAEGTERPPDFVVGFGTAAWPGPTVQGGCVVVGANTFVHDPRPGTMGPEFWHDPRADALIPPTLSPSFFSDPPIIDDSLRAQVEPRLLKPPISAGEKRFIIAAANYTSVGTINIPKPDDFAWADPESIAAFQRSQDGDTNPRIRAPIGAVDTTLGLIRLESSAPYLFVAGIVNQVGEFNLTLASRPYAQNFVASHNAAVVVAWLLPRISTLVGSS